MKDVDFEKLEADIVSGNNDAVAETIAGFYESDLTPAERGEIMLNYAMISARVKTKINQNYLAILNGIIADLKLVDQLEREAGEKIDLDDIRKRIQDA